MFEKIKLIVLDVDGVLAKSTRLRGLYGEIAYKSFYDKDSTALRRLKEHFDIIFLSGDNRINEAFAEVQRIHFYYEKKSKGDALLRILDEKGLSLDEVIFIGDDFVDLDCIEMVPLSMCPKDAIPEVREKATIVMESMGGCGVVVELYDMFRLESEV